MTTGAGSTACRRWATPTSPGCSTSSTTWRRGAWRGSCWRTARCRRPSPARVKYAGRSSRPTLWTASSLCRANCSGRPRFPPASGSSPAAAATGNITTGGARPCSSTPASWATWWTARIGICPPQEIARVADTYHAWRGKEGLDEYCRRSRLLQERQPGRDPQAWPCADPRPLRRRRTAGADDGVPFAQKWRS